MKSRKGFSNTIAIWKRGIALSYGFHENINAAFILMTENANAALSD
ncbi:hypothetical protein [Bartonella apihabitans]